MEVFRALVTFFSILGMVIGIAIIWKSKNLSSGRPKDQILWRNLVTSLFTIFALRVVCLMVIDPIGDHRFSNGAEAMFFIAGSWASHVFEIRRLFRAS